jgi:hypothetical protein
MPISSVMTRRQLVELCATYHLPCSGNKPKLKDHLRAYSLDRTRWERYAPTALRFRAFLTISRPLSLSSLAVSPSLALSRPLSRPLARPLSPSLSPSRAVSCPCTLSRTVALLSPHPHSHLGHFHQPHSRHRAFEGQSDARGKRCCP